MEKQVNKFIQPDPQAMDKVPAQMMIYDGQAWLEISNQQTINEFGQITTDLRKDADETMLYVQKVEDDFKRAGEDILNEIDRETTRLDKSIADAKLDTKNVDQRVTEINSRNQQKAEEIKNNLTLIDKKIDDTANQSQQSLNKMKTDVSVQLQAKSVEIVEAKKQAIENAETALKEFQTTVTTKFEDTDNKLNGLESNYASLDVKINGINTTVATKADKSYVDQKAGEINSVVANKADISYVDQKASQWQIALQNLDNTVSGKITATKQDLASLYESETYKGMQKIVQNSAFLQNSDGFTTQVQELLGNELKQVNLVYNSEFESGDGQEIEGWTTNYQLRRGTNMYDNYYGSTTLSMWTFSNSNDRWVNACSQMIDVNEGDHLSASVVAFYTGGVVSTPLGRCGIEIELLENERSGRKVWAGTYEEIANIPYQHEKTLRIDDYIIPKGITKARIGLVIRGKGNVMFAHPMLVKGKRVGIYQPSVINKLSKLTQTLDGLKSEVHDNSINSVIGQTARMIALQISGDKNKVISQINASTEGIMIDGKHILINGNTRIQGTLMVNDVVMKSQNNAVKFSPESLDMIGANSMLKLQSDSIQLGATSNDPRKQWGIGLSKNGLAVTVPVKKPARVTNNPEDYQREIQGYINGGGWDYTKAEAVGSGASGIEIGLMTQQIWGDPYGGDYIAIGQYTPTNSQKTARTFTPAISYSETGVGWAPRDIHMYKPTTFHSEMHMNVPSTGYGIRTAWVSWSDWNNEKYPCFVNDTSNWGGIAFPSNGNAVMFNSAGKRFNIYETKDNKYYNGYGGN